MVKNENLPEPNWRDQLYGYGFTDEDIDAINVVASHRFLIQMNLTFQDALVKILTDQNNDFHKKMILDVTEVIAQELRPIKEDVAQIKINMEAAKIDNDKVHEELTDGLHKLMARNKWRWIILRLIATAVSMYYIVRYAHFNWW